MTNLQWNMETYANVTISALCNYLGMRAGKIRKAAKAPIPGEIYDPEAINYIAMEKAFGDTLEKLTPEIWQELNDNVTVSPKFDMSQIDLTKPLYIKKAWYDVIHMTDTHVVIQLQDTATPQVWSIASFMHKRPSNKISDKAPRNKLNTKAYTLEEFKNKAINDLSGVMVAGKTLNKAIEQIHASDDLAEIERIVKINTPSEKI